MEDRKLPTFAEHWRSVWQVMRERGLYLRVLLPGLVAVLIINALLPSPWSLVVATGVLLALMNSYHRHSAPHHE
jgi:O-antigen/teichoic acid export membrane protein